ncbi:MAG TPA: hypothetical protein VFA04_16330 [Bryobacteraceae bacterium]|nr:hypothetical protein [Bryobacteraceae bacterium]
MGICSDQSVTFLKNLGYNVVRHPNAAIKPLDLIGVQNKQPLYLGPLNLLITNPPGPLPAITANIVAADINGQSSSTLKIGVGVTILGNLIGAMGGSNLGASADFTNARQITFAYNDVLNDQAVPLEIGNYLRNADVDGGNKILQQYVLGNGNLYLITKTAKSRKFTVHFERSNGVDASVTVPVLSGVAGGNVSVAASGASSSTVSFTGTQDLIFAFQCFQVGVKDGVLTLVAAPAGATPLAVEEGIRVTPELLPSDGLIELGDGTAVGAAG